MITGYLPNKKKKRLWEKKIPDEWPDANFKEGVCKGRTTIFAESCSLIRAQTDLVDKDSLS